MSRRLGALLSSLVFTVLPACNCGSGELPPDGGAVLVDAGSGNGNDGGASADAGQPADDAGTVTTDGGPGDAGTTDAGTSDAGAADAGLADAGAVDAGGVDAGPADAGSTDAGSPVVGPPDASVACTTPVLVAPSATFAITPDLATNGHGDAITVWRESKNGLNTIWTSRATFGQGFSTPQLLTVDGGNPGTQLPRVVSNAAGHALAWWYDGPPSTTVWTMWSAPDAGFTTQRNLLATTYSVGAGDAVLGLDPQGNAVAAWVQYDAQLNPRLWVARSTAGGAWTTPVRVDGNTELNGQSTQPSLAVLDDGTGVVTWQNSANGGWDVLGGLSATDGGWTGPVALESSAGNTDGVSLAVTGNVGLVAWRQHRGGGNWDLTTARWDRATGFTQLGAVEVLDAGTIDNTIPYAPRVALDAQGRGLVCWRQSFPAPFTNTVRATFWSADAGFSAPQAVSPVTSTYILPVPTLSAAGRGAVSWFDGAKSWVLGAWSTGEVATPVSVQGTLTAPNYGADGAPHTAVLPDGRVLVVFSATSGSATSIYSTICQ